MTQRTVWPFGSAFVDFIDVFFVSPKENINAYTFLIRNPPRGTPLTLRSAASHIAIREHETIPPRGSGRQRIDQPKMVGTKKAGTGEKMMGTSGTGAK